MKADYKVEAVAQLAKEIKADGFRVFIAERGTYGFYTDEAGSRIVSFQFDLGGFRFTGNYKTDQPRSTGTGWQLQDGSYQDMFNQIAPQWALRGASWQYTTLEQHLKTYQWSSKYAELLDDVPAQVGEAVHYGMTEAQARRKAGSGARFEGPLPLCGNGSYHAGVTSDAQSVTCEACKAILKTRPAYL
jgi:hypothetical protein